MARRLRAVGRLVVLLGAVATGQLGLVHGEEPTLLQALDAVFTEEAAAALLEPHLANVKNLAPEVIEKVVLRQWWTLARDIVSRSHAQQADLSFSVRKAVRTLKDEADELLRMLNPKYGQAQQVSPAFQWAQNDTCVFLTIKYTVRWNAPGALEVTEPSVNMTLNTFNFSGLGKHSNNKYRYFLSLSLFDHIVSESSQWSAASVGKLSVTLRKKWARKWPRLIANKKVKIGNMHMWMEMQEKLDNTLSGMTTVSNSPITCQMGEKLYCSATDTCKKADACHQCPGKNSPHEAEGICAGLPSEKAGLIFKDTDMDQSEIGGDITITKAKNEFDITAYEVYFGKSDKEKLQDQNGGTFLIGSAAPTGGDVEVKVPFGTPIPEGATHLLVFSKNEYGEYDVPGQLSFKDAVLPKSRPKSLLFEDEDGDKGEISGKVTIGRPDSEEHVDEYALHWGKSDKRKISSGSSIRDVMKSVKSDPVHMLSSNTKVPEGATHILAFAKNEHGEHPVPASVRIADAVRPCLGAGDDDCPQKAETTVKVIDAEAEKISIVVNFTPAKSEESIQRYKFYWGRRDCSEGGQSGAKNGYIGEVNVGQKPQLELPGDIKVPPNSTHILVFSHGRFGESEQCVAALLSESKHESKSEL